MMIHHPCGCINEIHRPSGVMRSVAKCERHRARMRGPGTLDESYYAEFGIIKDGRLQATNHVEEMSEALGPFPPAGADFDVLEIGCGVSPYVNALVAAGWRYTGLDQCPFAARWMRERYGVEVHVWDWESWRPPGRYGLILSAHSLEHMVDAPAALEKMAASLEPGGLLYLLVPDDRDPVNPDHLWFWTEATLRACVERAGLSIERFATRRIIAHEDFLYCRARRC